ncbi:hypothetical protein GCM10010331_44650 [Streptomyces xanthochromogenes]|nr:hypothetical protein GCM10010331_44650 [Streptomyces xanthochromogenes]
MKVSLVRGLVAAAGAALLAVGGFAAGHVGASSNQADITWNGIVAPAGGASAAGGAAEVPGDITWD